MAMMLSKGAAGDQVVVQISEEEWQVTKDLVHQALESLGCILEAEWHV
jgi:hypothetical protein